MKECRTYKKYFEIAAFLNFKKCALMIPTFVQSQNISLVFFNANFTRYVHNFGMFTIGLDALKLTPLLLSTILPSFFFSSPAFLYFTIKLFYGDGCVFLYSIFLGSMTTNVATIMLHQEICGSFLSTHIYLKVLQLQTSYYRNFYTSFGEMDILI